MSQVQYDFFLKFQFSENWIVGGSNGIASHDTVYIFDEGNKKWNLHSESLKTKRAYHAIGLTSQFDQINKMSQCSTNKYDHCKREKVDT